MPNPTQISKEGKKQKAVLTLEDMAHFVIYRELDKLGVLLPYKKATLICRELREAVTYRSKKTKMKPTCQLCGEPMPEGEEMFNYHGYSGNCPKPPLKKANTTVEVKLPDGQGQTIPNERVNPMPQIKKRECCERCGLPMDMVSEKRWSKPLCKFGKTTYDCHQAPEGKEHWENRYDGLVKMLRKYGQFNAILEKEVRNFIEDEIAQAKEEGYREGKADGLAKSNK